ncbi:hypothetical protein SY88_23335 [Clostridiales bacterium PH28_bin88]|jgi:SMC interacting uncharacterized protein involved in chromosome segregation|nr:hypothetical protein SY88_23335 [Clostridiales bacterium PH28_bin88]
MKSLLKKWLGIDELEQRVAAIEGVVENQLRCFGKYKTRSEEELKLMKEQIEDLLASIENIICSVENIEGRNRAESLRRRLKNNLTRIDNALVA